MKCHDRSPIVAQLLSAHNRKHPEFLICEGTMSAYDPATSVDFVRNGQPTHSKSSWFTASPPLRDLRLLLAGRSGGAALRAVPDLRFHHDGPGCRQAAGGGQCRFRGQSASPRSPTFPDAEVMDGCRKAPIMTIGINPNLTAFAPGSTGASWCYPSFGGPGFLGQIRLLLPLSLGVSGAVRPSLLSAVSDWGRADHRA